jgi:hypothetical protein
MVWLMDLGFMIASGTAELEWPAFMESFDL